MILVGLDNETMRVSEILLASLSSLLIVLFLFSLPPSAKALDVGDCLPEPTGAVILEVSGGIACGNSLTPDGPAARFDAEMLEALGLMDLKTTTDWTDGSQHFEGPLVRDILNLVKASGDEVYAVAANDYAVTIPVSDFNDYGVILAMNQNGKRLSLRDRGPLWIVYPRDDHPELRTRLMKTRWIWQLRTLDVR